MDFARVAAYVVVEHNCGTVDTFVVVVCDVVQGHGERVEKVHVVEERSSVLEQREKLDVLIRRLLLLLLVQLIGLLLVLEEDLDTRVEVVKFLNDRFFFLLKIAVLFVRFI